MHDFAVQQALPTQREFSHTTQHTNLVQSQCDETRLNLSQLQDVSSNRVVD